MNMVAIWQCFRYDDRMADLLDSLRRALDEADESRYRIAKGSGVAASQLSRFINGERGLSVESAERLANYLGFEIRLYEGRTKRKAK